MTVQEFNVRLAKLENLLFAFAMKLTKNREDAKDLYQETAFRAFNHKDRYTMGTNFKAWVTTIMRNTFINNYRKKKTRNKVEAPIEDLLYAIENKAVNGTAESNILTTELTRIIDELKDGYKIPFTMFLRGYQYNEIAEHMDLPMGTVKSRIFFARKQLKATITDLYGENFRQTA